MNAGIISIISIIGVAIGVINFLASITGLWGFAYPYFEDKSNIEPAIYLRPANKPDPEICSGFFQSTDTRKFYFGNNAISIPEDQDEIAIVRFDSEPIISAVWTESGLKISADIKNSSGLAIIKVIDNRLVPFENDDAFGKLDFPDKDHELIVYDESGAEILNIEFLNKNAAYISGQFNLDSGVKLEINDQYVIYADNSREITVDGYCARFTNRGRLTAIWSERGTVAVSRFERTENSERVRGTKEELTGRITVNSAK